MPATKIDRKCSANSTMQKVQKVQKVRTWVKAARQKMKEWSKMGERSSGGRYVPLCASAFDATQKMALVGRGTKSRLPGELPRRSHIS